MLQLADTDSDASQRLNSGKDALLDSPQVLNFISGAVAILCDAIKTDLMQEDSGIAAIYKSRFNSWVKADSK